MDEEPWPFNRWWWPKTIVQHVVWLVVFGVPFYIYDRIMVAFFAPVSAATAIVVGTLPALIVFGPILTKSVQELIHDYFPPEPEPHPEPAPSPPEVPLEDKLWKVIIDNNYNLPSKEVMVWVMAKANEYGNHAEVVQCFSAYFKHFPPHEDSPISVPLYERVQVSYLIKEMTDPFKAIGLNQTFEANLKRIYEKYNLNKILYPHELQPLKKLTNAQIVDEYLRDIPFQSLFNVTVPYPLNRPGKTVDETRCEHMWLMANSGQGKTETLKHFFAHDLERLKRDEIALVVVEPKDKLISSIEHLEIFDGPLKDKLVVIDADSAPEINPLRMKHAGDIFAFLFDKLEGDMTGNQTTLFSYCLALLQHVPDANLMSLYALMDEDDVFAEHYDKLEPVQKRFFEKDFKLGGKFGYKDHRVQVAKRLNSVATVPFFREMFTQSNHTFDFGTMMAEGKVILIKASTKNFGEDGSKLIGRFFLALAAIATDDRADQNPIPAYIYIDEVDYFCKDDPKLEGMLSRARQNKVGMVLAHRFFKELGSTAEALKNTCSIILASGLRGDDQAIMARYMSCPAAQIGDKLSAGQFGVYIRGRHVVSVQFPKGTMDNLPVRKLTPKQKPARVLNDNVIPLRTVDPD